MSVKDLALDPAAEADLHAAMKRGGWPSWSPMPTLYRCPGYRALVGREHCGGRPEDPLRWHISLSGPGRVPSWGELVEAAHLLRPGVPFVVSVPPRSMWMNVHPHVLHLWETGDAALIEEWKVNAQGDQPT